MAKEILKSGKYSIKQTIFGNVFVEYPCPKCRTVITTQIDKTKENISCSSCKEWFVFPNNEVIRQYRRYELMKKSIEFDKENGSNTEINRKVITKDIFREDLIFTPIINEDTDVSEGDTRIHNVKEAIVVLCMIGVFVSLVLAFDSSSQNKSTESKNISQKGENKGIFNFIFSIFSSGPSDDDLILVCKRREDYGVSVIQRGQTYYSSGDSRARISKDTKIYPVRLHIKGNKIQEVVIQTDKAIYNAKQAGSGSMQEYLKNHFDRVDEIGSYKTYPMYAEYYFYYNEFGELDVTSVKPL